MTVRRRQVLERRARARSRWRERLLDSAAAVTPGRAAAARRFTDGAIVLLYHRIGDRLPDSDPFAVSVEVFEQQIAWLTDAFSLVAAEELAARAAKGLPVQRAAAITFDDGDASVVERAFPVLEAHRAPATVFVDVGGLASGGGLVSSDLRALAEGRRRDRLARRVTR